MTRLFLPILMMLAAAPLMNAAGKGLYVSDPANLKGKEYTNPIIHADYSDPDVVAAPDGKTFYMTASSFQCAPGLPILKSTDLVNWRLVNHAITEVPPTDFYAAAPRHGKGVWAPCIRYHEGEYYIFWGDPDFGIYMVKAADPEGSWSEPVLVKAGKGLIDPTPLWDNDGRAWLANAWAASRAGFNSVITVSEMAPDGTRLLSAPHVVFDGNDGVNHTIEGPKLYSRDGWYYIFAPAGGVTDGWQLAMRSRNINGPYEVRTVMARGDSDINGPHQGGWVTDANGDDWFIHFQDKAAYGRIIHLNPMRWTSDGWPVIGIDKDGDGCGTPLRKGRKPALEAMTAEAALTPVEDLFEWHANYSDFFCFQTPSAIMRIYGHKLSPQFVNLWEVPNLWLMKFHAEKFTVTARLQVSAKADAEGVASGMLVMGWDYARLSLEKRGDAFVLRMTECTDAEQGGKERTTDLASIKPTRVYNAGLRPNMECDITMRVDVSAGGICRFSYSLDNGRRFTSVPAAFTARAGKWIGAKLGFFSITPDGIADRGWMDITDIEIK